jgi:Holliday junction resolvase RusA-like endonuclease
MRITFEIPIPPAALSPNARPHFMQKARAKKELRRKTAGRVVAASAARWDETSKRWQVNHFGADPWPGHECTVHVRWIAKTNRRRDRDNIISTLKAAIDGITDSGLWDDDAGVKWGNVETEVDAKKPRVVVTVERVEGEAKP